MHRHPPPIRRGEPCDFKSQLVELRRQIKVAGHELAAEYIDDGYTGMVLDRPLSIGCGPI
jgi:hypothetical protein